METPVVQENKEGGVSGELQFGIFRDLDTEGNEAEEGSGPEQDGEAWE